MVQTLGEFWQNEAEREGQGRSGGELAGEFWDEIEEDSRACERKMLEDKEGLLRALQGWDEGCEEEDRIRFYSVVSILDAHMEQRVRSGSTMILAQVVCGVLKKDWSDGKPWVRLDVWSEAGSYYDPPDGGEDVTFLTREQVIAHLREHAPERERLYDVLEAMGEPLS
jgi:hypothetical protein